MHISEVTMSQPVFNEETKTSLRHFLNENKAPELVGTYLYYLEQRYQLKPVLFPRDKTIFRSADDVIGSLEKEGKLWHEAEIVIGSYEESVNEQTKKIYICPFTGKVFGDNTHPNPQDAIYDWVSKCPENKEKINGLRVKRFYVSEDAEVIKGYIQKHEEPVKKVVYSSAITGKLFSSKEAVINDFRANHLKSMTLTEVQGQNRYQIEAHFLSFIQEQLTEERIASFVEALSDLEEFLPYVAQWVEE